MTIYVCIAANVPGYSPDFQDYREFANFADIREHCGLEIVEFIGDGDPRDFERWSESGPWCGHVWDHPVIYADLAFAKPESFNFWLARDTRTGRVLTITGMTAADYFEHSGEG